MKILKNISLVLFFLTVAASSSGAEKKTLAEIWLAPEFQNEAQPIKDLLKTKNITRVTIQVYRGGVPAGVIAIGMNTPAESARAALELAKKYNRKKVEFLIPEVLLPENYFAVGTSAYDEVFLVPVASADIDRLADPSLSTDAFHALYQKLTHADEPYNRNYKREFNNSDK